ncbi:MAG: putative Diguanylate cyclase/phosphodiesterase [Acidimicrobiales bacterium]|nr:putative Diguanylate cyclase/phosphodiesterase [Acidimicrobiales bacterium]
MTQHVLLPRARRLARAPAAKVWTLTVLITAIGLALGELRPSWWGTQDLPLHLEWWMLVPAFAASEIFVIHYQFRRQVYTFTLSELPLAVGLFFASWPALLLARLVGAGVALRLNRKQSPMKMAFNLACNVLETSIAVVLFRLLAGHNDGRSLRTLSGAAAGVVTAVVVVTAAIAIAIAIYEGWPNRRHLVRLFVANLIVATTNSCVALVAVAVLWVNPKAGWLLLVVAAILFVAYRSYARLQQKHDDLELLYDFTRRTGRALQVDSAMRELLGQIRAVLRSDMAAIVVRSSNAEGSLIRTVLAGEDGLEIAPTVEDPLWMRMEQSGRSLLAATPIRDDDLRDELDAYGAKDALVAPLRRGDGTVLGMMIAANRLGDQRTFTAEDLKLFEALANHASVSLENRHLIERLRAEAADKEHQAQHDALTGLPNRMLFQERVAQALAVSGGEAKVAVMLLDLDRFKEVNDTLGHHNGDLLLQEIGDRLRRILRAGDTVARLGGDEFAVLLPDLAGEEAAMAAAEGICHALERPFAIAEVNLDVGCSIGVAIWPDHGDDATLLLQRADVAMYSAKESQRGVDVYDAEKDTYSLERLALVGELRTAIERGELAVHYQPKADVGTGQLLGMEALIRWHHPRHGDVPPEEIIAIAEQTGLIRPLTLWVLNQALRQCRQWRRDGRPFDVAVNLSIRNILDAELPADVLRLLTDLGLPASALTFEITETAIMSDPVRTVAVLGRLRSMGVRLAIDDFGTGYSSFSHLRRLPVDEIKIDKSFVQHLATDESDLVIVRSIVDLGHNLGLRVVAEGVEDDAAWQHLAALGCDVVQGYILTRPLAPAQLETWLAVHGDAYPAPVSGDVVPLRNPAFRRL